MSDLLAKAMTRTAKIAGVPYNFVLLNASFFLFVMLFGWFITHSVWAMFLSVSFIIITHLVMTILCFHEDKRLNILSLNALYTASADSEGISTYSPLQKHGRTFLKEHAASKHIPYASLLNPYTVVTKKGELMQVVQIEGLSFETKDESDLISQKNIRNRLLSQMANPSLAIFVYTIRKKATPHLSFDSQYEYATSFEKRFQQNIDDNTWYTNEWYVVFLHKAPFIKPSFKKSKALTLDNKFYQEALNTLDTKTSQLISLYLGMGAKRLQSDSYHKDLVSFLSKIINHEERLVKTPQSPLDVILPYQHVSFAKRKGVVQLTAPDNSHRYIAILHIKEYPDDTSPSLLDVLLQVDCSITLCQSFYFKYAKHALKELTLQQNKMQKTDDSILLADELDLAIEEVKSGQSSYGEHNFSLSCEADSEEALNKSIRTIETLLNQRAEMIVCREHEGIELAFWGMLAGNHNYRVRRSLISSLIYGELWEFS